MITFIIPAHNEEAWVGRCLSAICGAMEPVGTAHEIIVVDDSSTDGTASIAHEHGARVIRVEHRQLAAPRNAGAREASVEVLYHVDDHTRVRAGVIECA